jgi:hypothetical protein
LATCVAMVTRPLCACLTGFAVLVVVVALAMVLTPIKAPYAGLAVLHVVYCTGAHYRRCAHAVHGIFVLVRTSTKYLLQVGVVLCYTRTGACALFMLGAKINGS